MPPHLLRGVMIDWKRKYGEVGCNQYGIKWMQDGKVYNIKGIEVNAKGEPIPDPIMTEEDFDNYEPSLPQGCVPGDKKESVMSEEEEIELIRGELRELGVRYAHNAGLEALRKKLKDNK
jgi:hypothetical protein